MGGRVGGWAGGLVSLSAHDGRHWCGVGGGSARIPPLRPSAAQHAPRLSSATCAVLCCAVLCCAVLCCAVLWWGGVAAAAGVRASDLRQAAAFDEVQRQVAELLGGRIVVGHAIQNDLEVRDAWALGWRGAGW